MNFSKCWKNCWNWTFEKSLLSSNIKTLQGIFNFKVSMAWKEWNNLFLVRIYQTALWNEDSLPLATVSLNFYILCYIYICMHHTNIKELAWNWDWWKNSISTFYVIYISACITPISKSISMKLRLMKKFKKFWTFLGPEFPYVR